MNFNVAGPMVFRDCNPIAVEKLCSIRIIEGHRIYVCYETCDTDGCNAGNAVNGAGTQRLFGLSSVRMSWFASVLVTIGYGVLVDYHPGLKLL